jgi:TPR repeat protein
MIMPRHFVPILFLVAAVSLPNLLCADAHEAEADQQFEEAVTAVHDKAYRKALRLFKDLAENDISDAQFNAALLIKAGMGQPRNYSEAYYWAVLSDLGGESRAETLVSDLANILPDEDISNNHTQILDRLSKQLSDGNSQAIIKFARLHFEFLQEPDYETAYIWYSIAQAMGINGGFEGSKEVAEYLEAVDLIAAQNKSVEIFESSVFAEN